MVQTPAKLPNSATVREVGPRDGLQNEEPVAVADRVRLVDALSRTGLRRIEVGAFVHPDAIPPMAGSEEVFARIERVPGVRYTALVPNARGVERAFAAGADEVEVVVSASTTHNERNVRRTTEESMKAVPALVTMAHDAAIPVQGIVATAFGCPYEGDVDPIRVAALVHAYLDAGCDSVCLGDTTGMATPTRVWDVIGRLPACDLTLHLHNTRGTGLANVLAALEAGVTNYDASVGGMGGCPYAPGATGNIVTEDLVHMLEDMGVDTGVDLGALVACAAMAEEIVGRELPSQVLRAGPRTAATAAAR
ncbi:MAG: hydroxymethylglutaryl-CoA lyase [Acidimicrobiia bacterium]|nr:hydroxymethylglutaryl-CoA lyase [Acidimicrobiia bacterium]